MQQVQATASRLAEETARRVVELFDRLAAGVITVGMFRSAASSTIARANAAGVTLADLGLTAEIIRRTGRQGRPLGLVPTPVELDVDRIAQALDTALAETLEVSRRNQVGQVARSEPLLTVATAVHAGMVRRDIGGWVRLVDSDPCPLCRRWADGVVRPTSIRMARHLGCCCIQEPVLT